MGELPRGILNTAADRLENTVRPSASAACWAASSSPWKPISKEALNRDGHEVRCRNAKGQDEGCQVGGR